MDEFDTRINGSVVAHSRYLAAHASALSSDALERLIEGTMPFGTHTPMAFASKVHANLAVLPHLGPYCALEWGRLEKRNGRGRVMDSRGVAHSRLSYVRHCYPGYVRTYGG